MGQEPDRAPPGIPTGTPKADDRPIPYLDRVRAYYQALGYGPPYRWAHFADVPFTRLPRPLARMRVALVTTAALFQPERGNQGPGAPYNASVKFYRVYSEPVDGRTDVRISHVAYDRTHTTAEDSASWFPLAQLQRLAGEGRIGALARRFHGLPTNRSQRTTLDQDAPELLQRLREDGAEAVVLVANCPVCHQSVSLAARHLEVSGIPSLVMGCAKDIVEHVGVPRFLFSDFPLGNAAGRPHDRPSQAQTMELALDVLEHAPAARTTVQSPLRWSENALWKRDYCSVDRLSADEITQAKREFDAGKTLARERREESRGERQPR